jgi:hypothetical protein
MLTMVVSRANKNAPSIIVHVTHHEIAARRVHDRRSPMGVGWLAPLFHRFPVPGIRNQSYHICCMLLIFRPG